MNVSERSGHPTTAQVEALIDYLERNPDLAKGYLKTQNARDRSKQQWEVLSVRLNSMGGTIKSRKQWTKYWIDKKRALKKKVGALAAARRKTGGGVEHDTAELSEVEQKMIALCGGAEFATGDTHLGIQPFPVADQTEPIYQGGEIQSTAYSNESNLPQQHSSAFKEATDEGIALNPKLTISCDQNRQTARRLFVDSEDVLSTEPSPQRDDFYRTPYRRPPPRIISPSPSPQSPQSLSRERELAVATERESSQIHNILRRSNDSPSPLTLSHAISSIPNVSPSRRRGANNRRRIIHSSDSISSASNIFSSSNRAQPPTPVQAAAPPTTMSVSSPSRRGATSATATTSSSANRNVGATRGATSSLRSSRAAVATPPSQRRTEFSRITERFLRVEERQLEIQQSYVRIWQSMAEQNIERDRVLGEAMRAIGEGLKSLSEALRPQ